MVLAAHWMEGFLKGTDVVLTQNENLRLRVENNNMKVEMFGLPDEQVGQELQEARKILAHRKFRRDNSIVWRGVKLNEFTKDELITIVTQLHDARPRLP